jgi:hypothetical protein
MANASSRRIVRMSLDLDVEQKNFLRMFAVQENISASIVMRALIYLLETDIEIANRVLDEIFLAPEPEADEEDDDAEEFEE